LEIGNSANSATGFLELELCNKLTCFSGQSGELQNMVDNGIAQVQLNGALPVQPDDELTYRITRVGGANSFALWLWPTAPDQDQFVLGPLGQLSRTGFRLTLQAPGSIANPVYADRTAAIYALPAPAPYASAENCQLEIASRTAMTANCSSPSRLVRREFFMPGWRATVEGRESPVTPQDTIFQSVALPAGVSHIVFGYAPPFVGWSYAAFCLGAVLLCLACWQQARQSAGHSWPWLPRAFWQAFRRRYAQPQ